MKYELKSRPSDLRPKTALVLSNLGDHPLFYSVHGSRHPLGVYNLTFGEIVRHMKAVLDELDLATDQVSYASIQNYDWHQPLLNAMDHLLDAVIQHLEALQTIVEAFFESKHSQDASQLKKAVSRELRPYRDRVGRIVNAIKHSQAKLASIYFHDIGLFVPGYFVEGVCADGAIGPDPNVHPSSQTAISFNRDLPFHMIHLYFASAVVGGHLQKLIGTQMVPLQEELTDADKQLGEVFRRLSILSRTFFPDEEKLPMPLIEYRGDVLTDFFTVKLEYPAQRIRPRPIPTGASVRVSWSGDGASKTFKVPYFGGLR